jgi:AraC family transcriptional regulator
LAKIAVNSNRDDGVRGTTARIIAAGRGWAVSEVVCTLGPRDRPFEERHSGVSIAMVTGGTFTYRSHAGSELMTPGSLLLGGAGQPFECSHDHGAGDRCIAFSYSPEYFGALEVAPAFRALRVPPLRALSPLHAVAEAALNGAAEISWEELAIEVAVRASTLDRGLPAEPAMSSAAAKARVARIVREIDHAPDAPLELDAIARAARLSPYHFLRIFREVAGVTPHQHLLRRRLHRAALRLADEPSKIVEIAFASGFGDVSNFNRAFRSEFGVSPRAWRRSLAPAPISPAAHSGPAHLEH